jgi:glycosyltransferase involved in cell wall biosynthesis
MKVVQTNKAYYPLIGGVETIVKNLSEGLFSQKMVAVDVLVCNDRKSLWVQKNNVNNVPVTYVPMWTKVASLPISPTYFLHLARLSGDILHIHEPFPLADLSVISISNLRKKFSRIVVSWHSDIVRQKWAMSMYSPLLHKFLRQVDRIIVATPNHITSSKYLKSYVEKCEVIPYGLPLTWVAMADTRRASVQRIQSHYGSPLLLFVGRLVYYKGIKYLIEALQMLPDARLVIIGSGPLYAELQTQITCLGLQKRITILPHIPDEELYSYYEACDIFILPSTEISEAFGLVQVEAMACGKPVISTELQTGTTYVNQHGITGLVVPPKDSRALAKAIDKLLRDESLRQQLGKNAKGRAFQEFTIEKMVERTYKVYEKLLSV